MPIEIRNQRHIVIVNVAPIIEESEYQPKIQGTLHRSAPGWDFLPTEFKFAKRGPLMDLPAISRRVTVVKSLAFCAGSTNKEVRPCKAGGAASPRPQRSVARVLQLR